jgi:hypothetical protein
MKKTFWVALAMGIFAVVPLAHAVASNGGFGDGIFHGWAVELGLTQGLTNTTGSALMGNDGYGMAFGFDGRPKNTGIGFFAACLALYLALFLLPVWFLKRHHHARQGTRRTIQFLPLAASFHLRPPPRMQGRTPRRLGDST